VNNLVDFIGGDAGPHVGCGEIQNLPGKLQDDDSVFKSLLLIQRASYPAYCPHLFLLVPAEYSWGLTGALGFGQWVS